jgi:hypothetical protein
VFLRSRVSPFVCYLLFPKLEWTVAIGKYQFGTRPIPERCGGSQEAWHIAQCGARTKAQLLTPGLVSLVISKPVAFEFVYETAPSNFHKAGGGESTVKNLA